MSSKSYFLLILAVASLVLVSGYIYLQQLSPPIGSSWDKEMITTKSFNENYSLIYKMPYDKLHNELSFAKLTSSKPGETEKRNLAVIKDRSLLIDIIREFERLNTSTPGEYEFSEFELYSLSVQRRDSAVTFVFLKQGNNYYEGSPARRNKDGKILLRKMPKNLIELIGL